MREKGQMKKYKLNKEELAFLLKINKMSVKDLAELIGVKRQTIYYWRSNTTSIDNIKVIAYYLKSDVKTLLME